MTCSYCEQEMDPRDRAPEVVNDDMHYYCLTRSVVGSVGHQFGRCSCNGGTFEDPPRLTRQQAAIAAHFLNMGRHQERNFV
jgi:hypothetical protein